MRLLLLPLLFLVVVHGQYITVPNFPFIDESLLPSELSRLGLATAAYSGSSKDFSTQLLEGDAEKRGWDVYPVCSLPFVFFFFLFFFFLFLFFLVFALLLCSFLWWFSFAQCHFYFAQIGFLAIRG